VLNNRHKKKKELITTNKERLHEENEKLPIAASKCPFASSTERK
jgi:hypothetical protein